MNALDIVLVLCAVLYALTGFQQGFVVGACATVGLVGGAFVAIHGVPWLLGGLAPSVHVSIVALLMVLVAAFIGQGVGAALGSRLRERVTWRPARLVDSVSGAALSVVAMLLVAWVLGVAAGGARLSGVTDEVQSSRVLAAVNRALPGGSDRLLSAFSHMVGSSAFPRYLEPFETEVIRSVPPPSKGVVTTAGVRQAERSVVKVLGDAPSCDRRLEGSGFVFAPGRVMTNAHVVAGVTHPVVRIDDTDHAAVVVYYDPDVDVAVLAVPGLATPPVRFGGPVQAKASAAVLGYPEDGPFDAEPARIRSAQRLSSPNIYGDGTVERDTYAVYSLVRPGNSGGPLVSPQGRVVGVVFAASLIDSHTGYALTAGQVAAAAARGSDSETRVGTGGCAE